MGTNVIVPDDVALADAFVGVAQEELQLIEKALAAVEKQRFERGREDVVFAAYVYGEANAKSLSEAKKRTARANREAVDAVLAVCQRTRYTDRITAVWDHDPGNADVAEALKGALHDVEALLAKLAA